jgi:PqqD family protein of HPr-rel-A system
MSTTVFQSSTVLACNPAVAVNQLGDRAIVHDRSSGQVHVITASAARILELVDGETTVGEVTERFAGSYGVAAADVHGDVEEILGAFHELSLVGPSERSV